MWYIWPIFLICVFVFFYASDNTTMKFGDLVSTSNTYNNSEVTVDTDTTVIWTMGIESFIEAINNEAITPSINNK